MRPLQVSVDFLGLTSCWIHLFIVDNFGILAFNIKGRTVI